MAKRRRRRELIEADLFHAIVVLLLRVPHSDWTEWEEEWLLDQAQRPADYVYSESQWRKLHQLILLSKSYTHYAGYAVQDLFKMAYRYFADGDQEDQKLLTNVLRWQATDLKLLQIRQLASIARLSEAIPRDLDNVLAISEELTYADVLKSARINL